MTASGREYRCADTRSRTREVIALSQLAERFAAEYLARFEPSPGQRQALAVLRCCRTALAAT
jgi:hypothetical protein